MGCVLKSGFMFIVVFFKNFNRLMLLKNCFCWLKVMEVCRKCGVFCYDDCISIV